MAITFLTELQAAEMIQVSLRTMRRKRHEGNGPKAYKIGGKTIRYDKKEVEEWAKEQVIVHGPR